MVEMVDADLKWNGFCVIKMYDVNDKLVYEAVSDNVLLNQGKDIVARYLAGITGGAALDGIGVGDGDATPSAGDTGLVGTNTLRKTITDKTYVRPNLVVGVEFLFAEANFVWKEAGVYAGNDVVARALFIPEFAKTNLLRGTAEWTMRIS